MSGKKSGKKPSTTKKATSKKPKVAPVETPAKVETPAVVEIPTITTEADEKSTPTEVVEAPKKPKWLFFAVVATIVLVVGGAGYAYFGVYMLSTEYMWKQSLANTRHGIDEIVKKGPSSKKGVKLDGSFKMNAPVVADGLVSGALYNQTSDIKLQVGLSGLRALLEVRTLPAAGSTTPDVYVNVSGLKSLIPIFGEKSQLGTAFDAVDGRWLFADHTLVTQLEQTAGFSTESKTSLTNESPEQISNDLHDIEKKVAKVVNDRLLTDDTKKAVVTLKNKRGKEDFKGRSTQHVQVQVQKTQLHEFVIALKDTLKTSKLNDWLLAGSTNGSLEKAVNFDDILKRVDDASYTSSVADVWIDTGFKTIRAIRVYDNPTDTKNYVELFFDYKGGDDFPLRMNVVAADAAGSQVITLAMNLSTKTDIVTYSLQGTAFNTSGAKSVDVQAALTITPTDEKIAVSTPAGATNVLSILGPYLSKLQGGQQLRVVNPVNSSFLDGSGTNLLQ